VGAAADLIAALYDAVWNASLSHRADMPPIVRSLGASLEGRVVGAELAEGRAGPLTLCHGDACAKNVFTDADGTIVFVDWEDVRCASGVVDLAGLLVSSVEPAAWDDVIAAYGADGRELATVLPAAAAQGLLAMADAPVDGELAQGWTARLAAAGARIAAR
jgi:thiamine kinase-like enzyme